MKGVSELTDFYYKTLYPSLQELEEERKALKSKILQLGFLYILVAVIIIYFLFFYLHGTNGIDFFLFAYVALGVFLYKLLIKDYTSEFKEKIIRPLISAVGEDLHYSALTHLPQRVIENSKLFRRIDRLSGNDYVHGTIDSIPIEFSDIHAQRRHRDSKGRTSYSTIFQGLFIKSEFNKNFHGTTLVLPDVAQNLFGDFLGNFLQSSKKGRLELVKMDNIAFEKEFVIYSDNQVEARYILSHSLMQRLFNFQKKTKHSLYVSFNQNNIYLAIAYKKDLFEPSIFHSLLRYKVAMEYIETLHLAIGIVEELQLNNRIWSRE